MKLKDEVTLDLWEEVLKKGNSFRFKAFGISMLPLIRPGDILIIEPAKIADLSVGEIILYQYQDKPFLHRIIKKRITHNKTIFTTKGDFLPQRDQSISSSQILGKLVYLERNDQKIYFNTFRMRIIGLITSLLYPLTFPLLKTGHKLYFFKSNFKQNLGNLAPYRKIKRKTVPKNIKYEIVTKEELLSLAMFIKSDVKRVKEFIKMGNIYFQAKISKHSIAVVVVSKFWKDICPDQYWIMGLYVEPEHRLKGVAENLIKKTISELKNKKFKKVYITVFETNTPALNLYKKIGFKPVYNQEITDKIDKYYKETDANSPKSLIFRLKL